jgi:hypothetical protein
MIIRRFHSEARTVATFVVKRSSKKAAKGTSAMKTTSTSPLICVTGFSGGYLPDKDDFLQIFSRSLRPAITGAGIVLPKVTGKADDVFAEYQAYPISSNEGEVVFRLKAEKADALLKSLPLARNLGDVNMAPLDDVLRTAWCGVLLPVKGGKILNLTKQVRNRLKDSKQWDWVRWYSLVFRTFQPNALSIDLASDLQVKAALAKADPDVKVERLYGEDAKLFRVRGCRSVTLKCNSSEEVFALRQSLFKVGITARPAENDKFDLNDAFLQSEYRRIGQPTVSVVVRSPALVDEVVVNKPSLPAQQEEDISEISLPDVRDLRDEDLFVSSTLPPQDEFSLDVGGDDYYVVEDRGLMFASRRERMSRRLQGNTLGPDLQERAYS